VLPGAHAEYGPVANIRLGFPSTAVDEDSAVIILGIRIVRDCYNLLRN